MKAKQAIAPRLRQGDVYLVKVDEHIPAEATPVQRDHGRVILAYGEVTGHAHAIAEPDVDLFETTSEAADRFLRVGPQGAVLVHDEHAPITLEPGVYRARILREYSPEAIRRVAD